MHVSRFAHGLMAGVMTLACAALLSGCDRPGSGPAGAPKASYTAMDISGAGYAHELKLPDVDGHLRSLEEFKGKVVFVFFGFTHCPDVCPTTLFEISEIMKKLGADAKIHGLFVTVDPERDTAELLKSYLSSFDRRIVGLTGERPAVDAMLKAYRVYSRKVPGEGDTYSMDHSSIVYLMDREMRFVNAVPMQDQARAIAEIRRWM